MFLEFPDSAIFLIIENLTINFILSNLCLTFSLRKGTRTTEIFIIMFGNQEIRNISKKNYKKRKGNQD